MRKRNVIHHIMQNHIKIMYAANTILTLKYNISNTLHSTPPNANLVREPIILLSAGLHTAAPTIFLPAGVVTNIFIPNWHMVCMNKMGISDTISMNFPSRLHHQILPCPYPPLHFYHFCLPIFWKLLPNTF